MIRQLTILTGPTVKLTRDGVDAALITFDARHDATIFDARTAAIVRLGEAEVRHVRLLRSQASNADVRAAANEVYEAKRLALQLTAGETNPE